MKFRIRDCRELQARLATEHERDQAELADLRKRLDFWVSTARKSRSTNERLTEQVATLGGKINRVRQMLDTASDHGTHISIARVSEIVDE